MFYYMLIYIILILYTIAMAYGYTKIRNGKTLRITSNLRVSINKVLFFLLMILPAVLVSGFRYGISVDYIWVYEKSFYVFSKGLDPSNSSFELGFQALIYLCSKIVNEPWFMFTVCAFITICVFFVSFKESKSYLISVILFFGVGLYFDSFNGVRQYIVVAIFAYCLKYIKEQNLKKYILIMGLSVFIHTSALFTIPLYFLNKVKLNKIYVFGLCVFLFTFRNQLLDLFINIVQMFPKYNEYLVRNTLQNQVSFSTSGLVMVIIALIPCLISERKMQEDEVGNFLYNMVMLGLILCICSSFLPFAERLLYYTRCYLIFSIPYALSFMRKKPRFVMSWAICGAMCSMTAIGMVTLGWYAVLPYVSIFK